MRDVTSPPSSPRSRSRDRRGRRPWALLLLALAVAVVILGVGGWWAWGQRNPVEISGNPTEEFVTTPAATTATTPPDEAQSWPTYGYDNARTRWNPNLRHRPPFTHEWRFGARALLEFPPAIADGLLYVGQIRGKFFAVNTENGVPAWRKDIGHCSAATPAVADGIVYASFLAEYPCPKGEFGSGGYVFAWDAKTGERKWVVELPPVESSPLVQDGTVYVGAWDKKVYALDAATGAIKWTTETDAQIVSSASWIDAATAGGAPAIVIGTNGGSLYALDAATGAIRWKAQSNERLGSGREYFYATPTVAYGRVFIGNTDGWMYAYGAQTGKLIWAQQAGTYVYTGAVAAGQVIYIGTYDGSIIAFDAATGNRLWTTEAPGAVHGAPVLMDGLLYFSTCSRCGQNGVRGAKLGPDGIYAIDIETHKIVWSDREGKYSPLVADEERVYLIGPGSIRGVRSN
jgi:outer membrane protein assembly factor BamB